MLLSKEKLKYLSYIIKYSKTFGILLYIIGLVWFLLLSHNELNHGTYMSENALLTGLVQEEFKNDKLIDQYYSSVKEFTDSDNSEGLRKWLLAEMTAIGMDAAIQNFTLHFPDLIGDRKIPGHNTYGVIRSPGSARTESLLLCVPIRTKQSPEQPTSAGIGILLGLANFLRKQNYIAKDIIFLFVEMEYVGLQAWLDAYHGMSTSPYILVSELEERSGSLQAAIALEIAGPYINGIELKIEGLNGILPNLDLVNSVVRLAKKNGLSLRFQNRPHRMSGTNTWNGYRRSLTTLLSMMGHQATGSPTGLHGLLLSFQVPALTISSSDVTGRKGQTPLIFGSRLVEGLFRSLNNLQERLHQSFYFYLLPNLMRYVSIGVYTPPYVIMYSGLMVHLLSLWQVACGKIFGSKDPSSSNGNNPDSEEKNVKPKKSQFAYLLWEIGLTSTIVFAFGVSVYLSGPILLGVGRSMSIDNDSAMTLGIVALFVASLFAPYMIKRKQRFTRGEYSAYFLKCEACLFLTLLLGTLGVLNISMAFVLAVPLVPVALMIEPSYYFFRQLLNIFLLLIVSPLSLMLMAIFIQNLFTRGVVVREAVFDTPAGLKQAIIQSWVEKQLLAGWTFGILSLGVYPCWLMLWFTIWTRVPSHTENEDESQSIDKDK